MFKTNRAIGATDYTLETPAANVLRYDILATHPSGQRVACGLTVDIRGKTEAQVAALMIRQSAIAVLLFWGYDESMR